jgi:gluconolactonase
MVAGAVAAAEFGSGAIAFPPVAAASIRYPGPSLKVVDPRFQPLILGIAAVERIATGCRFNEEPEWFR